MTQTTHLVSIIIPCYRQAQFLGEAIESVLNQTYTRYEIIVVDDGSPDNTFEIATSYPEVVCLRQKNQGVAAARNNGIKHSKGEYIVVLDADDRLLPNALQAGVQSFEGHPECAFVFGMLNRIAEDGSVIRQVEHTPIVHNHYLELLHRCYIQSPMLVMYKRSILDQVGGFSTSVDGAVADYDLYLRISKNFPVHCHKTLIAEYRDHGMSMSHNSGRMLNGTISVLKSHKKHVKGKPDLLKAYRRGIHKCQDLYGEDLIHEVRIKVRAGKWFEAIQNTLIIFKCYPRGLAANLFRKVRATIYGIKNGPNQNEIV